MLNYFNYNYSNTKGTTNAGDTFNSSLNMGPSDSFYSSNIVKDEVIAKKGQDLTAGHELDWAPVKLPTFTIEIAKTDGTTTRGITDNFGNVTFQDGATSAVVTPAGTITWITAPTGFEEIKVTYKYDNTSVRQDGPEVAAFTNAPGAELQIKSVPVNAETRTMRAYIPVCWMIVISSIMNLVNSWKIL